VVEQLLSAGVCSIARGIFLKTKNTVELELAH